MEIRAGKYTIKSDKFCAWVEEEAKIKDGKRKGETETRRVTGYFRNFEQVLDDFIETKVKGSDAKSVEEVLKILDRATKDAKRIVREAKKGDFKIIRKGE